MENVFMPVDELNNMLREVDEELNSRLRLWTTVKEGEIIWKRKAYERRYNLMTDVRLLILYSIQSSK
jgi:hypothetical protein